MKTKAVQAAVPVPEQLADSVIRHKPDFLNDEPFVKQATTLFSRLIKHFFVLGADVLTRLIKVAQRKLAHRKMLKAKKSGRQPSSVPPSSRQVKALTESMATTLFGILPSSEEDDYALDFPVAANPALCCRIA